MERQLRVIAVAVFLIGLATTAVITSVLLATASEGYRRLFEANAENAKETVIDQVETSIALLRGVAGLVSSRRSDIDLASFRAYMNKVALREYYPGIQGIGFTRRLPAADVDGIEIEMREQGHAGFRVWPFLPTPDGALHSILFLEPLDNRNKAAIGYNMFSEPTRREAMMRARDSGEVAMSGVVELVQEIDERKQPGFLIYLPIYETGAVPADPQDRREQLLGFSYAPIRAEDFLAGAFASEPGPRVSFDVYHGTIVSDDALLYSHRQDNAATSPRYLLHSTADLGGERWTFVFRSSLTRFQALILPGAIAIAGVAFTSLLAMLFWREANSRSRVQHALKREQAARGQAERANRMKDQFLATLSHELRTPLTAIVGWAEVLRHARVPEQQLHAGLDTINRNAKSQARLIDDLLDMSKITSGKISLELEPVNLNRMLDDELSTIADQARNRSLRISKTIGHGTLMVSADPARLQQIFWNLFSNALKFAPTGGEIHVSLQRVDGYARLSVTDNGEGIDPAMLEHIFDHFAQADGSIKRRHGGLGLGLAITRELVSMHGGHISALSEGVGKGATFIVDLPLHTGALPGPDEVFSRDESLDGVRLLVVDDEADVRELLRVILEPHGATVRSASSGQEALDVIGEVMPDVVISDIGMPHMNGYELIQSIRGLDDQKLAEIPAVALTAYARPEDINDAIAAGYQLHMIKPVRPDKLRMAVRSLLHRQETPQALKS